MKRMMWLDDNKEDILSLYNSGLKQIEIAEKYGVSQTAISTRLRKWNASNPDGNRFKRIEIDKETLYDLYWNEKQHPSQIAKRYACHKQAITNKMLAYGIPFRTKSEARMGKLNPIYGVGHTQAAKEKMSLAFENGRKMGFNNHWGNGAYYSTLNQGKVWMRSSWETRTADYLTKNGIDWYYELQWIELAPDFRYLPDFYLPWFDIYIEVKGRIKKKDSFILKSMKELGYCLLFWDGEELFKRKIINNPGSAKIYKKYITKEPYVDDWSVYELISKGDF